MVRVFTAGLTGALFAAGLALSGMTQPQKVIAFLDVTGAWDASLMFVMMGAIAVFAPLFWWVKRRDRVAFGEQPKVPVATDIDRRLVVGSALFGLGWGIGGYCPGPAITAAGSGSADVLAFAMAMALGMAMAPSVGTALDHVSLRKDRDLARDG